MTVWVNGALSDDADATVSVFDHGLTVGDGVFETVKVVDGQPFAMTRHLARLGHSARGLGLAEPDPDLVRRASADVIAAGALRGISRLRITYTGGVSPLGSDRGDAGPSLFIAQAPVTAWPPTARIVTVPWPRNENSPVVGLKTTSYAENVVALASAHAQGASEAIVADTQGRLCEGTGSNIFVVLDGRLLTPSLDAGCLAGVTRALVVEWSGAEEADLPLGILQEADEVFITSSTRDVQAVHDIDGRHLAAPGPVTLAAAHEFARRSADDLDP